jgi:DNA polymerase V
MSKKKSRDSLDIYLPQFSSNKRINIYSEHIPAGFPSPAEDFIEKSLDLNDYLITNRSATFMVKVTGHSMEKAGIMDGDLLIIDRSVEPADGKIVLGVLNGEFTVKRITKTRGKLYLEPASDNFKTIEINPEMDFRIWGVVTWAIHKI